MPKGRTVRPIHSKSVAKVAAVKLISATRRFGSISKGELIPVYSRLINTEGAKEASVASVAKAAAELAAKHPQVKMTKAGLQWRAVGRGHRATD